MSRNSVLILDFGAQYSQLIARRVREANVYSEVVPFSIPAEEIKAKAPKGIILTGGPDSVNAPNAPKPMPGIWDLNIPILGLCYGGQLISQRYGGKVNKAHTGGEYGKRELRVFNQKDIFKDIEATTACWMSHFDSIEKAPDDFEVIAATQTCPVAAMKNDEKKIYALQFHPEVHHTPCGKDMLRNFLYEVCHITPDWNMGDFVNENIELIRKKVGNGKAICGLSGGVDSSVAAVLVHKAIGKNLTCVFVDHGLLRKDEAKQVETIFRDRFDMNLICVDAKKRFLSKLEGISDPEQKRKIIGEEFIRVFEDEKRKLGEIDYLVQGTIYPDVIESGTDKAAVIKSHHNVGGLPDDVDFELIEPLRLLFKDEVRKVGHELNIPAEIVNRQPFPGPGLAIRVLGAITEHNLEIVREADWILRDEIKQAGLENEIWQYFAALPNIRSVGVMGDERTYTHTIALRAVTSTDGMTSDWAKIPFSVLERISNRIVNEVKEVNRVVYDITSKPPATIEWE